MLNRCPLIALTGGSYTVSCGGLWMLSVSLDCVRLYEVAAHLPVSPTPRPRIYCVVFAFHFEFLFHLTSIVI